jgi:hypothetical protein
MTLRYWESIGGTLIEKFLLVPRGVNQGQRLADAVIIPNGPSRRVPAGQRSIALKGEGVTVVQTKASRLGIYLLRQALFSKQLLERFHEPDTVRSVALCSRGDDVLEPLAREAGTEVVTYEPPTLGPLP